jgi:hypothetical protein
MWVACFSCGHKTGAHATYPIPFPNGNNAGNVMHNKDYCPHFDSSIYHNRWVKITQRCYVSNRMPDSVFIINHPQINFQEFIQQTQPLQLKNLHWIEKDLYTKKYPVILFTESITKKWPQDVYYEDAEVYGYWFTPHMNYVVLRFYGACMGHFTSIISINKNNALVDYTLLTGNFGGKYGDGPAYEIKQVNDSVYNQVYEITTCRGWDDKIKKDSLFREYYSTTRITFSHTGYFIKQTLEVDSTLRFIKMVNICGPE